MLTLTPYPTCFICRRSTEIGSVRVEFDGGLIVDVCDICMEKADEGPDLPLDMGDADA